MAGYDEFNTDPAVCFSNSPFGFGPFPLPGEVVVLCPPDPQGSGYGGVGWSMGTFHPDFNGGSYGLSAYGSRAFARPRFPIEGGYGGDPYGLGPYGSTEKTPPYLSSAISLNGFEIEVYFSEEMDPRNPLLVDPTSYTITALFGAPATVLGVTIERLGFADYHGGDYYAGVLSVILRHTGTTLGGTYTVMADGPTDISGNPILPTPVALLTKGEVPPYIIQTLSGEELEFVFAQAMLPASAEPPGEHGILDPLSYGFTSTPTYPIALTPTIIQHPYLGDLARVYMKVKGMTSLQYACNISPATAIEYDGSILPSASVQFHGVELSPGNGTSTISSGHLTMSRPKWKPYGWSFLDTSGRVSPTDSSIRVDFTFNAAGVQYDPPIWAFVNPQIGQIIFEDGPAGTGVQVTVTLEKGVGGVSQIRVQSGTYDVALGAAWDVGTVTISLIRNMKAGHYAILFNETPILATPLVNFNGVAAGTGAGVSWLFFDEGYDISGFQIYSIDYTATKTVYSGAWNFLHNSMTNFVGSPALTRDYLLTQRGPLVKGWGDTTPATKQDVQVLVDGIPVGVKEVNPYIGKIFLDIPIPLFDPGDPLADVKVDYQWFCTPVMGFVGLNTEGLVLNKWDQTVGHHDPAGHGSQVQDSTHPKGAPDIARFPMALGLAPTLRPAPLLIGWRYMGFEREYSALLNSPTTMLLNQSPYIAEVPGFEQIPVGESVAFEGTQVPLKSDPKWLLLGADAGHVNVNQGTYTLIDDQSGAYDPDNFRVTTYYRNVDLSFPASVYLVGRFLIESTTPDGVFTGVGFGMHDDNRLYLVGALLINDLQHVGMLLDARQPQLAASWDIGPRATASLTNQTTMVVSTALAPVDFQAGNRLQILTGPQTGVFTAQSVVRNCDGTMTITVSPAFPADQHLYGNNFPTVIFETPWSIKPSTYRLVVDPDQQVATLSLSGSTTVQVLTLDGTATPLPSPADLPQSIMLPTSGESEGDVLWGSFSTWATNQTLWSFLRYGIATDQTAIRGHFKTVLTEMNSLPENDPNNEWFFGQTFGYSKIDSSADVLILDKTSASEMLNFAFDYERIEPFFTPDANIDLRAKFKTDSATLGSEDTEIILNDGQREVRFSTLMYVERPGYIDYRRIIRMPTVSMAGILDPTATEQGEWERIDGGGTWRVHESDLWLTQGAGTAIQYRDKLDMTSIQVGDMGGHIFEARFTVESFTGRADGTTGIQFSGDIGTTNYVIVRLKGGATPEVQLCDMTGGVVQAYPFNWTDGNIHTYRVVATIGGGISLFLDDDLQLPTAAIALFPGNTGTYSCVFGAANLIDGVIEPGVQSVVLWRSVSDSILPSVNIHRTIGVWKGGDTLLLNNWEIPRTDTSTAPNSAEIGPIVEDMDWRNWMEVRLLRTPDWGVTVFRTDLPLPPYYVPETPGVPGSGFATQTTEPSAGWINVEYRALPRIASAFGFVAFGTLEKRAISRQRWEWVRYNLFKPLISDIRAPQHMVLNYENVITSGELTNDVTEEVVAIQTVDAYTVCLIPTHLFAESIIKIIDGTTVFTYEMWDFDQASQTVTLKPESDGTERHFSGTNVAVTVIFNPGHPVTNTYLQGQPLLDGITQLNEGTPPVPMSQTMDSAREIEYGSMLNDPNDVLNVLGNTLNDPYKVVTFKDDPTSLYEALEFMQVTNGGDTGYISFPCECGQAYEFSGTQFWQMMKEPQPDAFEQGGGMPGHILFASGGTYMGPVVDPLGNIIGTQPLGGLLGPGTAILYPNFPSHDVKPGTDGGKIYRRTDWIFRLNAVMVKRAGSVGSLGDEWVEIPLVETLAHPTDTDAPKHPSWWQVNPDPPIPGAGAALVEYYGSGNYSHVGPWGGLSSLTPDMDRGFFDLLAGLSNGMQARVKEESSGDTATFTAKIVPINPGDFAIAPQPHVNLAAAINAHPVASLYVRATPGLTWAGIPAVLVESLHPTGVGNMVTLLTSDVTGIRITGTIPTLAGGNLLTGGAKIVQSSLLAGGSVTVPDGVHNPELGMICEGGVPLPPGTEVTQVVYAG